MELIIQILQQFDQILGVLVGALLVAILTRWREHHAWLLDRKLNLYSEIAGALAEVAQELQNATECEDANLRNSKNFSEWGYALDRLRKDFHQGLLICSPKTHAAYRSVANQTSSITLAWLDQSYWPDPDAAANGEYWKPISDLGDAMYKLTSELRRELGVKQVPKD